MAPLHVWGHDVKQEGPRGYPPTKQDQGPPSLLSGSPPFLPLPLSRAAPRLQAEGVSLGRAAVAGTFGSLTLPGEGPLGTEGGGAKKLHLKQSSL